jgi:chromosome segregation ATPase
MTEKWKVMSPRKDDPSEDESIDHGPKMTPEHDEIASFQRSNAKSGLAASLGEVPVTYGGPVAASGSKTLFLAVLVVVLLLAGWSGYLQMTLQATHQTINSYETRVADLEQRLMVTDESLNESGVATKVKIREMDSEIRKLWDNVWKKSKQTFAEHEAMLGKLNESIKSNQQLIATASQQLAKNDSVITGLKEQLAVSQQLSAQITANQQALVKQQRSLETTADKTNSVTANIAKLERRVKSTEEWVESVNGFRRQVIRDIDSLKQNVGQLQAQP